MGKSLVIVESPAKAKTINKYLGSGFIVKSSVGHIRDLPTSGSGNGVRKKNTLDKNLSAEEKARLKAIQAQAALVTRMGVDPENGWKARYEVLPGKHKILNDLKKAAANADAIYLATDLDREGEAIAWHLREVIGGDDSLYHRVVFSEITEKAITEAFKNPKTLNIDRVNAQQARRFLDRVVGFMLSPLLWKRVARGLSAGRVQSVATRIVVEREREIQAFIPDEYWDIFATLSGKKGDQTEFSAEVVKYQGDKFKPVTEAQASVAVTALNEGVYEVSNREDKPTKSRPKAPFITSTLQQTASVRLGFGVKRTMGLAQMLYQAGLITYMRTDSTNLSKDAVKGCRDYIASEYGKQYLPETPLSYSSKEGAQEAHEAIRPSDVTVLPVHLAHLEPAQQRLYQLIWSRFVACQMAAAIFDTTAITISNGDYELRARGRVIRFDGWTRVLPPAAKKGDEDAKLPNIVPGDHLTRHALEPNQHFTKPPPRFTEASLVRELEKRSIGRPSTYAAVISTIQERGYVRLDKRRMYAEKMGEIVTDRLVESFPGLINYEFTADMEQKLDVVAAGEERWTALLDRFYVDFKEQLALADSDDAGMRGNTPTPTDILCKKCQRPMAIRTARTGVFLGCTGYGLPKKERCTETVNLVNGAEVETVSDDQIEVAELLSKRRCKKCQSAMDNYLVDETRKLHVCGNNPDCIENEIETGEFKIAGYDGPILDCDKCDAEMQLRSGRFGKYFACTAEDCKNTRKLLRSGEAAPPKADPVPMRELPCEKSDGYFVLRDGAAGIFLASSNYPRSRETRNPLVSELLPHAAELDPKFAYLTAAPAEDPKGNPTKIRFSRKNKTQYVMSETADGKATGWQIEFIDNSWKTTGEFTVKKVAKKVTKKKTTKKTVTKKKVVKN